jgi:peptidoglycan/LPS O-acetylase OafA/YrhL
MSNHLTHPKYRADIDGLRAIAVLSVVGFHAFPDWIFGGFIGVDVFFVISGFLISSIIFGNLEKNSFNYVEFYSRRIKRIFPALILVLVLSFTFGWYVLLPDEFQQLVKHIAAGSGFVSNFTLWDESGYFDNSADTKPLLHLWSLAIEEQFYILWPLLLRLVWKHKWNFLTLTVSIAVASFVLTIYLVNNNPIAAFYSPLSRFWELMIGGILAYLTLHKPQHLPQRPNLQSAIGLMSIAIGILLINKDRAFPGYWALIPCVGAFLLISAGPGAWLNRNILGNKLLVWGGG